MKMNHTLSRIAALCLIILFTVPGLAQEATPDAVIPVEVIEAPPGILSLTIGEVLGIVVGLAALGVAIGKTLWDANQNPGGASVDERLTDRVNSAHTDREWVMKLEHAYELGQGQAKTAIDALTSVLQTIAPLTPLKVDDAALSLLKDVQTPGAMAQAASGTGYTITGNQDGVTVAVDTKPETPFAVTTSGTPIPNSQTPTGNLPKDVTNLHELGGAGPVGGEGFR